MDKRTLLANEFLDKYKELEVAVEQMYGVQVKTNSDTAIAHLERRAEYKSYSSGLKSCRTIRNDMQHLAKERGAFPVIPSQEMIDFLEDVKQKVLGRKKNVLRLEFLFLRCLFEK